MGLFCSPTKKWVSPPPLHSQKEAQGLQSQVLQATTLEVADCKAPCPVPSSPAPPPRLGSYGDPGRAGTGEISGGEGREGGPGRGGRSAFEQ